MSKDNGKKLRRETVKRVHDDDWLGWGIMDRSFECTHEDTLRACCSSIQSIQAILFIVFERRQAREVWQTR
jgi:hypothetical protein